MRPSLFRTLLWLAIGLGAAFGLILALLPPRAGAADGKNLPPAPGPADTSRHGIWCALLLASNQSDPKPLPEFLEPYSKRLKKRFGYNQYLILDETQEPLQGDGSRWFAPSEQLALQVQILEQDDAFGQKAGDASNPSEASKEGIPAKINFKIFQEQRQILDADAQMTFAKPLFIRGPRKGSDQLIFVLVAR